MPVFTKRKSKLHIQLTNSDQATAHGGQVLVDALCRRFDLWTCLHNEPSLDPRKRTGAGFSPVANIAQLIFTLTSGGASLADAERMGGLRDRFENAVLGRISGARINGARWGRLPNTSSLHIDGVDGEALVIALDLRGFAVSTGAACSSGAIAPSHVLTAIGLGADGARSSLRVSLGRANTAAGVDALAEALEASVAHLRRISVHA